MLRDVAVERRSPDAAGVTAFGAADAARARRRARLAAEHRFVGFRQAGASGCFNVLHSAITHPVSTAS